MELQQAVPLLRRPFTPEAVKWRIMSGNLIAGYIDARLAIERLNLVCPNDWQDEFSPIMGGALMCRLTVCGQTRHDVGDGADPKTLFSDAFKRAAVKFGVGVSLYAQPTRRATEGKITAAVDEKLRAHYTEWLKTTGIPAFGEPLDHGDRLMEDL